jgi:tRNA(Ile)-lysidine synthase
MAPSIYALNWARSMLSTILRTIRAQGLVGPGERVVVGVSGGPDSMALVHALARLAPRLEIEVEAATVDHGLRPAARAEAERVCAWIEALGLPWHGLRVDVAAARQGRASLQDAARRARLGALEELAARRGALVALGHQADDQAETVLFRVVRGTGLRGLAGIPYRRGPFIRPLLDATRADVLRYLARHRVPSIDDPSNADARFARARIRHQILPALAVENPRVREALVALAAAARAVAVPERDALPPDLNRRAFDVIDGLRARGAGTHRVDVSGGRVVEVAYGRVHVAPRGAKRTEKPAPVTVANPGVYTLVTGAPALHVSTGPAVVAAAQFDADALAWPLLLRGRRPGDRMRPRGGRGSRKLSDLLIDAKIPRDARDDLPVLTTADDVVLFVPGLRPAEAGRPSPTTKCLVGVSPVCGSATTDSG